MGETDITVPADVWPRALLEELVSNKLAGVAFDETGQKCVYCGWWSESYKIAAPRHERACPIKLGRDALKANKAALAGARPKEPV